MNILLMSGTLNSIKADIILCPVNKELEPIVFDSEVLLGGLYALLFYFIKWLLYFDLNWFVYKYIYIYMYETISLKGCVLWDADISEKHTILSE